MLRTVSHHCTDSKKKTDVQIHAGIGIKQLAVLVLGCCFGVRSFDVVYNKARSVTVGET